MNDTVAVYVHIPYCKSKCGYCDFCSSPDTETLTAYKTELIRRIRENGDRRQVKSVYFGGGTPTFAGADVLCEIYSEIKDNFSISDDCETTFEANPKTADLSGLKKLREAGFNRISFGQQTFVQQELSALMRTSHNAEDGKALFGLAREAGFENISLDLMYGIPSQTVESLKYSLSQAVGLGAEHISAYALKLEEGTPLYAVKDKLDLPDDDTCAAMYEIINDALEQAGYHRYEISNFCKPGYESRHNLRYWQGGDYLGFGVSAASLCKNVRYLQSPDMDGFLSGKKPDAVEILEDKELLSEYVMLHLRLGSGIDKKEFSSRFNADFDELYKKTAEKYVKLGLAENTPDHFRLNTKGMFLSNTVICDFI